jgi:hypothetical protein
VSNESRSGPRKKNKTAQFSSVYLTSAYVGIQALLEVAAENKLKLAKKLHRHGWGFRETRKSMDQNQDEMGFKLK